MLFLIGLYFYRVKDTEWSILFLTGDYSGLNKNKICRDTGKRIMIWSIPFLIGIVIDIFNPMISIKIAFVIFAFLLLFHIIDMSININKRYKL
jgi:hypothetical protein